MSRKRMECRVCGLMAAITLCWCGAARAQVLVEGQTALENVSSGSVHGRAPGKMVIAGLSRAQEFRNAVRGGIEITEPAAVSSPRSQLIAESIAMVFNQINLAIVGFHNLLLARAARPLVIPENIVAAIPTAGTGGGADNAANANDLSGVDLSGLDLGGLLGQLGGR